MTADVTWVLLGFIAMIALVMVHRSSCAASSHNLQLDLEHKRILDLAREETMRLQLLVNAYGSDVQGEKINRRRWWPGPPEPPPPPES